MSGVSKRVRAAMRRLDNHWVGDVIGAVSLFVAGLVMIIVAGVLS